MERAYLYHEITADDKTRFAASVTTTEGTTNWKEATNYIPIPDHVVGITESLVLLAIQSVPIFLALSINYF